MGGVSRGVGIAGVGAGFGRRVWSAVAGWPSGLSVFGAIAAYAHEQSGDPARERARELEEQSARPKDAERREQPDAAHDERDTEDEGTGCRVASADERRERRQPREGHEHEDRVDGPQRGDDRPDRDVHGERGRRERERDGYPDGGEHREQHDVEGAAAGVGPRDGARDGRGLRGDLRRDLVYRTQVCHRLGFGKAVFHAVADGLVVERERLLDLGVRQLAQRPLELG